jgi:hypothetical protein
LQPCIRGSWGCPSLLSPAATGPAPENTCSNEHAGTPQVRQTYAVQAASARRPQRGTNRTRHPSGREGTSAQSLAMTPRGAYPCRATSAYPAAQALPAPFAAISHPSAAHLGLAFTCTRAVTLAPKVSVFQRGCRYVAENSLLPCLGVEKTRLRTECKRERPRAKAPPHTLAQVPPTRTPRSSEPDSIRRCNTRTKHTSNCVMATAPNPDAPLPFFAPLNARHRAIARWFGMRGRLLLMGCCYRDRIVPSPSATVLAVSNGATDTSAAGTRGHTACGPRLTQQTAESGSTPPANEPSLAERGATTGLGRSWQQTRERKRSAAALATPDSSSRA